MDCQQWNPLAMLPAILPEAGEVLAMANNRHMTLQGLEHLAQTQDIAATKVAGQYHVEITTTSESVAMSLQVLRLVMAVTERVYTAIERETSACHAVEMTERLRRDEQAVAKYYWACVDQGLKHRRAIAATVEYCETAKNRQWNKTDVGYCVKSFSREACLLNLPAKGDEP